MAAILGAAMMRAGSALAGSKVSRSVSGSLLAKGGPDKQGLEKSMKTLNDTMQRISKLMKKTLDLFSRASPALKQQLIIINKSLLLFLRPIGDIMAKFVRPMAIWLLKFAMKWYSLFGGGGEGGNDTKNEKEDALRTLKEQRNAAAGAGDNDRVAELDKKIAALEASIQKPSEQSDIGKSFAEKVKEFFSSITLGFSDFVKKMGDELFTNFIPEAFQQVLTNLKDLWVQMKYALSSVWETLKPILQPLWELAKAFAGLVTLGALKLLQASIWMLARAFQGLGVVFDMVKFILADILNRVLIPLANFLKNIFMTIWEKIKDGVSLVVDKLKSFYDWIVKIAQKVQNLLRNPFSSKAVGGEIEKSGLYNLHAGERVVPAGENSRDNSGSRSFVVNVYQNIQASVSNDIDIRSLAKKLADLQELEMRRRVPY